MKKKIILYDVGMGGLVIILGGSMIPLIIFIIILMVKTIKKIKQYRREEQELIEKEHEKL